MDVFSDIKPVPLDVILSWPAPNYVNPERRGPALLIVNCILLPLALIIVALRLYTRLRIAQSAGLDDLFIAVATACSLKSAFPRDLADSSLASCNRADDIGLPR